ncbi:hypothetical protein [Pararhizobium sp. LjRoot255]|uniref:hypothetical protein n=1 Tax=Pararhizobium sp. LjRoot255 TaxID=3342298 RepID=UPI003F4FE062
MALHSNNAQGMPPAGSGSAGGGSGSVAARSAADWLCLAAAPTFATMTLLTAFDGNADMICSAAQEVSPSSGMAVMYALMSVFHSAQWLRLIASRRNGAGRRF